MRTKLKLFSLLLIPLTGLHAAEPSKPNVVVFLGDDMGWGDSATYGHKLIKTPNLDKLASEGVKFTQCYSACGVCSPSRSAILTGRHPYRNGVWRHLSGNHDAHLRSSEITYPKLLKSIGYETCHVGKWHLNSRPHFNNPEYPQLRETCARRKTELLKNGRKMGAGTSLAAIFLPPFSCPLLLLLVACSFVSAAEQPPNVVLIFADDLGYGDVGCYGATKVRTPNIDRLAKEGRRFTDAHTASAVCTPSRYALLTGEYPESLKTK